MEQPTPYYELPGDPAGTGARLASLASPAVEADLYAMCPEGLITEDQPPVGVTVERTGTTGPMGEVPIRVRGPKADVVQYVRDNWGDDEADQWAEEWARFPTRVFSFADVEATP